jgi:hypothetical protein
MLQSKKPRLTNNNVYNEYRSRIYHTDNINDNTPENLQNNINEIKKEKPKDSLVIEIYKMIGTGYTGVSHSGRLKYIQFDKLLIQIGCRGLCESMTSSINTYMIPFVTAMEYHFSAIAICPFYIVNKIFKHGNEFRTIPVPVALEPLSFDVKCSMVNKKKEYEIIPLNNQKFGKIYVIAHPNYTSLNCTNSNFIDSECGKLIHSYLDLNKMKKISELLLESRQNPQILLQHETTKGALTQNEIMKEKLQEMYEYQYNYNGIEVHKPKQTEIDIIANTKTFPKNIIPCTHQPFFNVPIFDITPFDKNYKSLVNATYGSHIHDSDTGGIKLRIVEENKQAEILSAIRSLVDALKSCLNLVYTHLYGPGDISIHIPIKGHTSTETLKMLEDNKYINHETAGREILMGLGLSVDYMI